jgi:hypothetical protein
MRYLIIPFLLLTSCIDIHFFGESDYNLVLEFIVDGQSGGTVITDSTIEVTLSNNENPTVVVISSMTLSQFATSSYSPGDSFNSIDSLESILTITAESGVTREYKIIVSRSDGEEQIDNSGFEDWYEVRGGFPAKTYLQLGESSSSTIWATANDAVVVGSNANTTRYNNLDNSYSIMMKTIKAPAIVRIAAATAFTGKFDKDVALSDPQNPRKAVDFGYNFTSRPSAIKFRYLYKCGDENRDGDGNLLDYDDRFDAYLLLEVEDGGIRYRLGTAWIRGADSNGKWVDTTISIKYGELSSDAPIWEIPESGKYASKTDIPTHLSLVMSSSCKGDYFEGAIGSELIVDYIELLY